MADNVAELGFKVDSKPIDDATKSLQGLGDQAQKTSENVNKLQPSLQTMEATARRSGISVEDLRKGAAAFSAETDKLAKGTAAAGTAIGTIAKEAGSVAPALAAVGAASAAVTREHDAHSASIGNLRSNLKGLSPLLNQFGGGLGDVLQYSKAARLGLEGLAIVAGGALFVALGKVADEVARAKNNFAGLTGSAASGARAYDAVREAARSSGAEFANLTSAVEKAIIGQEQFADKNIIYANSADMVANKTEKVAAAFGTFNKMLENNLATADEEKRALDALGTSFEKTGTLTVDAFAKIREQSKSTALDIAKAFGFQTVKDFNEELAKSPITLDQFVKRMAQVKPQVDAFFDPDKPKTFEQAMRGVTGAWSDLIEAMAKAGSFDAVKNVLTGTKKEIEGLAAPIDTLSQKLKQAGQESEKSWDQLLARDETKGFAKDIEDNIGSGVLKVLAILGRLPGEGLQAVTDFVSGSIGQFQRFASSAVSAAQTAANAISQISKGGGGNAGAGGNPGSTDALGNVMGGDGGALPQGTDAGAAGFDIGMADLPAFATGGQFTVGGAGGTDSTLVQFKSTPGEVVTVSTPAQIAAQTSGSMTGGTTASSAAVATVKDITDAIDKSTIEITKQVTAGSASVVDAINKLSGIAAAPVVNPATGLPVAKKGASSLGSPSSSSSGGGGGFTTRQSASDQATDRMKAARRAEDNKDEPIQLSRGGASGVNYGQATPIRGFRKGSAGAGSFPFRAPTGSMSPYPSGDPMNGGAYGSGESNFYGTNYDGSGDFYGSLSDIGYGTSDFYGTDAGGSGNFSGSVSDIGYQDILSGGYDTGAIDYGGGSVDAGYFATGGSFKVPGSSGGGIDKTLVSMHATPGETVTVTPLPSMPAQAAAKAPSVSKKEVNIYVHPGIQAETFLKSRAQIARGM